MIILLFFTGQNYPSVLVANMYFTVGVNAKRLHGPYTKENALTYDELLHGLFLMLPDF